MLNEQQPIIENLQSQTSSANSSACKLNCHFSIKNSQISLDSQKNTQPTELKLVFANSTLRDIRINNYYAQKSSIIKDMLQREEVMDQIYEDNFQFQQQSINSKQFLVMILNKTKESTTHQTFGFQTAKNQNSHF